MMTLLMAMALATAQDGAPTALPAPVATSVPCELEGISAIDLVALRVAMVDQIANGTARPATADATLAEIEAKAAKCAPGDDAATDKAAATLAVARFAAGTIAEKLAADGIDMAKVDAAIGSSDPAVLDAFVAKRFDTPGVAEFGETVLGIAGTDAPPETRKLLGAYAFNKARLVRAVKSGPGR